MHKLIIVIGFDWGCCPFHLNGVSFVLEPLLLPHAAAHRLQEDTLLPSRGDTLLPHLQRGEPPRPRLRLSEGHHHLHHQSAGSLTLHLLNKEVPQSPRDARPPYLQSIEKGLPQAAPPARPGHHNQTKGIRPHHGLGLLRPLALPLLEEELQRPPMEGSPHLQVPGLSGESPGLQSPKR